MMLDSGRRTITIKVTYQLLEAVAMASDIAKDTGKKMYVIQKPGEINITHERPIDRKEIVAQCYPGGRRQFMWPVERESSKDA